GRRDGLGGFPVWSLERGRDVVVQKAAAGDIAFLVVADFLIQGGPDPLGEAAVDLTVDDHRVDDVAAVVHRDEAPHLDLARAAVDVHHADIAAEGEGEVGRIVVVRRLQPCLHTLRMIGISGESALLDGLRLLRSALDVELARLPLEVALAYFQQVRGELFRLVADLARGKRARRAGSGGRAAGVSPKAIRRRIRVAFLHLHVRGGNTELLGDNLRIGGLVALALALRAEARDRLAGRVDADLGRVEHLEAENIEVPGGPGADYLGEAADADAHQLTALAFFRLLAPQRIVADEIHRLLQRRRVVPAVVFPAEHRVIGELLVLDEILHAQLGRVHVQLLREGVGGALDRVHRLRDAEGAAI